MEIIVLIVVALVMGGVGYWIAGEKNRDGIEGAALGCLLGPIGWIIEAVLPTKEPARPPAATPSAMTVRPGYAGAGTSQAGIPDSLQVPFWSHPDSQRPRGGRDGRPDSWLSYTEATAQEAVDALVRGELNEHARTGNRVVEAVWTEGEQPRIQAAFGRPDGQYDLLFPGRPRVVWQSRIGEAPVPSTAPQIVPPTVEPASEASPEAAATQAPEPETPEPETPEPSTPEPSRPEPPPHAEPSAPPVTTSTEPPSSARPTKNCPDCAETVLADARICRFCRYEFWPRPE